MSTTKPQSELKEAITDLSPFFKKAAFFSTITSILILAPSAYMLEVYDRVVNSRSHLTLAMLTILVLCVYALMEVLDWVRSAIMEEAATELDKKLGPRVFSAVFANSLSRTPGGTMQAMADFRSLREFVMSAVPLAYMEAPVSLMVLVLLFAISPVLGWFATLAAVAQVLIGWLNERGTQPPLSEANKNAAAAQQYADASLRNAEVIHAMGMTSNIHQKWLAKHRDFLKFQAIASDHGGAYQAISKFLQNTVTSMLLGLGAWLLLRNQLSGGAAYMIVASMLGGRALAPLVQLVTQWSAVIKARDAFHRLDGLLASSLPPLPAMTLPPPRGQLSAEGVIAGAPGGKVTILKGISFTLNAGEAIAVIGPSASGKSTLAKLLVGIWPAIGGKVRLDGVDLFAWNKQEVGAFLGYSPQNAELFEGTVAQNIARFGKIDMHQIEAAAAAVGMHDLISALAEGYETLIGDGGTIFSGGQKQRIALARAIYGQPKLVVLDEPNSHLDEAGDTVLADAILALKKKGTTFVLITHRTSLFKVVDKILVLNEGQTQLVGDKDDVLAAMAPKAASPTSPSSPASPFSQNSQPRPAAVPARKL